MTDFDTSAIGALKEMRDALKEAREDTPEGKRQRMSAIEAFIGLMLIVIAILTLLYMPMLVEAIQYFWSK